VYESNFLFNKSGFYWTWPTGDFKTVRLFGAVLGCLIIVTVSHLDGRQLDANLEDLLQSCDMMQHVVEATRSDNVLNLLLTSASDNDTPSQVAVRSTCFSIHNLVACCLHVPLHSPTISCYCYHDIRRVDLAAFHSDIQQSPLYDFHSTSVDSYVSKASLTLTAVLLAGCTRTSQTGSSLWNSAIIHPPQCSMPLELPKGQCSDHCSSQRTCCRSESSSSFMASHTISLLTTRSCSSPWTSLMLDRLSKGSPTAQPLFNCGSCVTTYSSWGRCSWHCSSAPVGC